MSRFPGLVGGVYHLASRAVLNYHVPDRCWVPSGE